MEPQPGDAKETSATFPPPDDLGGETANAPFQAGESGSLAASGFELSCEGMVITGPDLNILHANRAFTAITGYRLDELIGKMPGFLDPEAHNEASFQEMWTRLAEQGHWQGEVWERRKDGTLFPAWLTLSKTAEGDSLLHLVGNLSDISEKKQAEARANYLNLHDTLTGLPNKTMFLDRLAWSLSAARRRRQGLGVLALSLDISRPISVDARDIVLKQAGSRLLATVRESDAVARFDDNKLVVLLDELSSVHHAEWVAKKILWAVRQPFTAADREARMDVSIGVSLFPQHDADAMGLVNKAEWAMNEVRSRGKNNFQIFSHQVFSYSS